MNAYIFCWSESDRLPYDIAPDDLVIAADSGYKYAERCGVRPDIVLGDFDSLDETYVPPDAEKITLPKEKDETDALYAVRLAISKGCNGVYLVGGLGGRLDHTLGALAVLRYAAEKGVKTRIDDGYTSAFIVQDGAEVVLPYDPCVKHVSFFPSNGEVTLSVKGLKYTLDGYTLKAADPLCVSNEFVPDRCGSVYAKGGDAVAVMIKQP